MKFFGKVLIVVGVISILFAGYLYWQRNNPNRIAFTNTEISASELKVKPEFLIIEKLKINLPIIESKIVNYQWETTSKGISRIGNVYYGHNWTNLLGNLVKVKPDDVIEIKYSDNKIKRYKVTITQIVSPQEKNVLNLAGDKTILIYTCTGFMDSKRFVVVASEII